MHEPIHPLQVEGFRRMSPATKLQMVADLYAAAVRLGAAELRLTHPDWTHEQLEREARRSLPHAAPDLLRCHVDAGGAQRRDQ
jgi:hypothetical protein